MSCLQSGQHWPSILRFSIGLPLIGSITSTPISLLVTKSPNIMVCTCHSSFLNFFHHEQFSSSNLTGWFLDVSKRQFPNPSKTGAVGTGIFLIVDTPPKAHIIQDTGKSTFDPRRGISSIDLNRAGTALMEIVSEPDMR